MGGRVETPEQYLTRKGWEKQPKTGEWRQVPFYAYFTLKDALDVQRGLDKSKSTKDLTK